MALSARVIAKALSQPRDAPFVNRVKIELHRNPNFPIPNTWIAGMGRAARKCNLCEELLSRKPNSLNELYRGRAPWEESPATFNFTELPNSKANSTEQQLKGAAEEAMRKVFTEGCTEYFTDGSVDNSIPATGVGVFSTNFTGSWRISNTCSTLQTKLIAILKALEHSLSNGNGAVVIHTDSKSALQAIRREDMKENSLLMSSIVACLELHKVQSGPVCLHWIPCYIGIPGNESADRLANGSLRRDTIAIKVQRSLGQVKTVAKEYEKKSQIENHQMWTDNNARSVTWYQQATHMNPHPIVNSTTRNLLTIIHRLRLGYRCTWEIVNQEEMECNYCEQVTEEPLLHYLLKCEATDDLRRTVRKWPHDANMPDATEKATEMVFSNIEKIEETKAMLLECSLPGNNLSKSFSERWGNALVGWGLSFVAVTTFKAS